MVGTFSKVLQDMDDAVARVGRAVVNTALGPSPQPGPYYHQQPQYQYPGQPQYHPQYAQPGPTPQPMYHAGPSPMQTFHQGPPMPPPHQSYQHQQARPPAMHANSWPHPQPYQNNSQIYQHPPQSPQKTPNPPSHQYPPPGSPSPSSFAMHSPYEPEPGRTHWGQPLPSDGRPSAVRPTESSSPAGPPPAYSSISFDHTADEVHSPPPINDTPPPSASSVQKPGLPPRREYPPSIPGTSPSAPPTTHRFEPPPPLPTQYQPSAHPLAPQQTSSITSPPPPSSLRPTLPPRDTRSQPVSLQRPPASVSTPPSLTTAPPPSLPIRNQIAKPRERSATISVPSVKMPAMPTLPPLPANPTLPNIHLNPKPPQLKHTRSHSALDPNHPPSQPPYTDPSNLSLVSPVSPLSPGSKHRANTTFINIGRPVSMLVEESDLLAGRVSVSVPGLTATIRNEEAETEIETEAVATAVELPAAAVVPPKDLPSGEVHAHAHAYGHRHGDPNEAVELPAQLPVLGSNNPFRSTETPPAWTAHPRPQAFELVGSPTTTSPIIPLASKPVPFSGPARHSPGKAAIQGGNSENEEGVSMGSDKVSSEVESEEHQKTKMESEDLRIKPVERKGTILEEWNHHGGFSLGYGK